MRFLLTLGADRFFTKDVPKYSYVSCQRPNGKRPGLDKTSVISIRQLAERDPLGISQLLRSFEMTILWQLLNEYQKKLDKRIIVMI